MPSAKQRVTPDHLMTRTQVYLGGRPPSMSTDDREESLSDRMDFRYMPRKAVVKMLRENNSHGINLRSYRTNLSVLKEADEESVSSASRESLRDRDRSRTRLYSLREDKTEAEIEHIPDTGSLDDVTVVGHNTPINYLENDMSSEEECIDFVYKPCNMLHPECTTKPEAVNIASCNMLHPESTTAPKVVNIAASADGNDNIRQPEVDKCSWVIEQKLDVHLQNTCTDDFKDSIYLST